MKSALQEFKLLLNRTGAGSAYAAYALAFDPANGEYWVDGEQYGDPSEPFVTNAEAQTLARWFTDANATITKPASSIVITKVADGAGATWAFADAGRLVIGQRHRLRMNITVSDKARISIDGVTYDNGTTGWGFVADTPGTYDVDLSGVAHITGNFSIIVALANLVAWAANGATVTINSMTVDIEGVTALPGYSFTRTGEQGAVKSQTYGDELIVNGDGSSTTGWTASAGSNLALVGGKLRVDGQGSTQYAYQSFATVVGKSYRLQAEVTNISASVPRIRIGTFALDGSIYFNAAEGTIDVTFTATAATTFVTLFPQDGGFADYDNVSVQEILPTVEWFPANVPAINDRGYHAYGALTNNIWRSQEFDNAAWSSNGITVTANTNVAPDGTTSADTLSGAAGQSYLHQSVGGEAIGLNTQSIFVHKTAGTAPYIWLQSNSASPNCSINFNITTGAFTANDLALPTAYYAVDCGAYWRVVVVYTAATTGNFNGFGPASVSNQRSCTAGQTLTVWQSQSIPGNFPDGGPLIRTAGATASIGASTLSGSTLNPYTSDTDFVLYGVVDWGAATNDGTYDLLFSAGGGTFYIGRANITAFPVFSWGAGTATLASVTAENDRCVVLLRRRGGKWTLAAKKGSTVTLGTESGVVAFGSPAATAFIGIYQAGANEAVGKIEGVFAQSGTFSDAEITEILENA